MRTCLQAFGAAGACHGTLRCGAIRVACAFGWGGLGVKRREGDGKTPLGLFAVRYALVRAGRIALPATKLKVRRVSRRFAWCVDPRSAHYNRPVLRPFRFAHEQFDRNDRLYDLVLVLGVNDSPPERNRGSAFFLHAARSSEPPFPATEGCIAVARQALRKLLPHLTPNAAIRLSMRK